MKKPKLIYIEWADAHTNTAGWRTEEILKQVTIEGNILKLPKIQLDRKAYLEVAKKLELIGGKWKGGKIGGFVFQENPTDLVSQIANGEQRNLKKEYQFFATPAELADKLVQMANIEDSNRILEPSAGQGAIIDAISRQWPEKIIDCYELMDLNQTFLKKNISANLIGSDFLTSSDSLKYDRIIANPPFSRNQDIDHIRKMYECLNNNGRIVTISSKHWQLSNNKKETQFRKWLEEVGANIEEVPSGTFKESKTMIASLILIIQKI